MKQFLLFHLGEQLYSLEIEQLQEIVEDPFLHFIPCAPSFYSGAMNFHGEILPVLDLGNFLGIDGSSYAPRVLVLTTRLAALALKVETARRIVVVDPLELLPPSAEAEFDLVQATFSLEGVVVSVLDLGRFLQQVNEETEARIR